LAQSATETGIVEPQIVAQCIQQRHIRIGIDRVLPAIDIKDDVRRHKTPPEQAYPGFSRRRRIVRA
jgi:hypothetical protein